MMFDSPLFAYLRRLAAVILRRGDYLGPLPDPDALVREPRPRLPKGRISAMALEEPREHKQVRAVGRHTRS